MKRLFIFEFESKNKIINPNFLPMIGFWQIILPVSFILVFYLFYRFVMPLLLTWHKIITLIAAFILFLLQSLTLMLVVGVMNRGEENGGLFIIILFFSFVSISPLLFLARVIDDVKNLKKRVEKMEGTNVIDGNG